MLKLSLGALIPQHSLLFLRCWSWTYRCTQCRQI